MSEDDHTHRPFHWRGEEIQALLLPLALLAVLAIATLTFGFAGLITVMLLMVAGAFAVLMLITRG